VFEVTTELLDSHEALLDVVFEDKAVDDAKRRAARKISRELNIPGFRRGRAPYMKVVHYVGEPTVVQEAAELLLDESYSKFLDAAEISPYGPGEFVDMQPSPLTFKIRVPLEPVVDLGDYTELREEWTGPTVSDDEIDQVLAQVREENAVLELVDRAAEMGDELHVNVQATVDGDVVVDEDDVEVVLSEERPFLSAEFVAALVGMKAEEESSFTLTLPDTIENAELQGAEAAFSVKVTEVHERSLPELDDALASTVGSFESFDELKQDIVARMLAQKQEQAETVYRNAVTEKLVAGATFSYPPQMISETLDEIVEETTQQVQRQGKMSLEDALRLEGRTIEQYREEMTDQAEARVKRTLALRQLALDESIEVSDDEVVQAYTAFLEQIGMAGQMAENDLDLDSPMGNNFRNTAFGRKVMERLMAIGRGEGDADEALIQGPAEADAVAADADSADEMAEDVTEIGDVADDSAPATDEEPEA